MSDFRFATPDDLNNLGTPFARYKQNIAALKILKAVERGEILSPAPDELTALSRYVGWGSSDLLNRAFPNGIKTHLTPAPEIAGLLDEEEVRALRSSSLTAFYTPLPLIASIYESLDHLGLKNLPRLRLLDPAAGSGHFLGAMPSGTRSRADCVAVELDPLASRIAQLLYPGVKHFTGGFEDTKFPQNFFDLVIGNVPFGDYRVADPSVKERHLKDHIHDYFFVKSIGLAKPGGLIAFITSTGTLDKLDCRTRRHLASHAELLIALRLPNTAFTKQAGTEVGTDFIILRKREQPDETAADREAWVHTETARFPRKRGGTAEVVINRVFIDNPSWILGLPLIEPSMYHGNEQLVINPDSRSLPAAILETIRRDLPADLIGSQAGAGAQAPDAGTDDGQADEAARREIKSGGSLFADDQKTAARAAALINIYAAAKNVLNLQLLDASDAHLQSAQDVLNRAYDDFVRRFGYINSKENQKQLRRDNPFVSFLRALEEPLPGGGYGKAQIFHTRTIKPNKKATSANNAQEALLHCLNERGEVDIHYISALARLSVQDAISQLAGLIFQTPAGEWKTADDYLSGQVREKLLEAEAAAALDPAFQPNVDALRAVQPRPLGPGEIAAKLGAGWIPADIIETYAREMVPDYKGKIEYIAPLAKWSVQAPDYTAVRSFDATQKWGTPRAGAFELLEDALNLRRTVVYDTIGTGQNKTKVLNQIETAAAQAKLAEMKEHFMDWVWEDPGRELRLCQIYNERFNTYRKRRYNGGHLTLPGSSTSVTLRSHQKDGIWRTLQDKTTLVAHRVGSGKTYIGVGAAMEMRRLGLARKPLVTVPKIAAPQWAQKAQELYPGIRLLTTDVRDFSKERRGETLSRIATGDWDLVVVPHPSFKLLPVSESTFRRFINAEIDRLESYVLDLKAEDESKNRISIKQLERQAKKLGTKLREEGDLIRRDDRRTVTWEEMGIDALIVDEFDVFKNLGFATKMTRISGLPNSDSQAAFDMFMKIRYLLESGGRVIGLTGTPVSNTVAEVYTIQTYLQRHLLEQLGIAHFDAWVQMFAEPVTGLELKVDGSGYRNHTRLAHFVNVPELSRMLQQCVDIRSEEDLDLPLPKVAGGGPIIVPIEPSPAQVDYTQELADRSETIKKGGVEAKKDNMLKVTGDGRKAALDIRLVRPDLPEDPNNKIDQMVDRVVNMYMRTIANSGVQSIFLDSSTPKGGRATASKTVTPVRDEVCDEEAA